MYNLKWLILTVTGLLICGFAFSQATVRGKISDASGETLIGVAVVLKDNRSVGTVTDFDGNFSLKISDSTETVLLITYVGYQPVEEKVQPKKGEVVVRNFVMKPAVQEKDEVTIEAKAVKSKEYFIENVKKKSATTIDYISSETIRKTGDANVTAAVTRVTGVSTNGSFITVRGIGDRYVKTSINGSRIPTLDPFTNNIKLDLFPASLVDNIIITKTASPDLPGDFAGAYISVETKDYPDQLSISAESSVGYNNQSTLQNVLTSQRSKTDWLGFDNSFREHDHSNFVAVIESPTEYQQFVALGLGSYYNELGITSSADWNTTYYKLGLVQLGYLAPALFNDEAAYIAAHTAYISGPQPAEAFRILNANVPASAKSLPNNWNTSYRKAPLNFSQSFSIGNQTTLFGRPLGFIGGFRYGSSIVYDADATTSRATMPTPGVKAVSREETEENSKETNGWSALANIAYKLSTNHSVSFLFMPNLTGVNNVRYSIGTDNSYPNELIVNKSQFYEERKQLVYQAKTEHYITALKLKVELNASYTDGESSAPDFKNLFYTKNPDAEVYGINQGSNRSYRYLLEDVLDSRLSAEFPLSKKPGFTRKIKFGGAYQDNQRESNQYNYIADFGPYASTSLGNVSIDDFFSHDKFELRTVMVDGAPKSSMDIFYLRNDYPADRTIGYSKLTAGFVMIDYSFTSRLRFAGGLRVEHAEIFADAFKYDSLGYADDDPRRYQPGQLLAVRPGRLDEFSFLPSANMVYAIKSDETNPVNVRLNYSQAVARPSIREMTDIIVYDYEQKRPIFGNSELKMVRIDNYDLRLESYFKSGDNISLSFFYKDFKNHIEVAFAPFDGLTWINVDESFVRGIELEGKKVLTKHFDIRANITLAESQTTYIQKVLQVSNGAREYIPGNTVTRNMFGQAPYVVNGMLTYASDTLGLSATISYNIQGPRLVISSSEKQLEVYELPRHVLDFKVSKKFGKHFGASLTVRDILNAPVRRSYNYDEGWEVDYDHYRWGTNYVLALSYKL